jgi:hypothetical protein
VCVCLFSEIEIKINPYIQNVRIIQVGIIDLSDSFVECDSAITADIVHTKNDRRTLHDRFFSYNNLINEEQKLYHSKNPL